MKLLKYFGKFFIFLFIIFITSNEGWSQDDLYGDSFNPRSKSQIKLKFVNSKSLINSTPENVNVIFKKSKNRVEETPIAEKKGFDGIEYVFFKENYCSKIISSDSIESNHFVVLQPYIHHYTSKSKKLSLSKLFFEIENESSIGYIGKSEIKYSETFNSLVNGNNQFYKAIERVFREDSLLLNSDEDLFEGKKITRYLIAAKVTDMWVQSNYDNAVLLTIDWSIYDTKLNKVVLKRSCIGAGIGEKGTDKYLEKALQDAAKNFLNQEEVVKFLNEESAPITKVVEKTVITKVKKTKVNSYSNLVRESIESTVTVVTTDGHGSGFIISENGYLLTNYHVVNAETNVTVILSNELKLSAEVLKYDQNYDLALLKINGSGFKPMSVSDSSNTLMGDEVIAIGTPYRIELGQTVTKGIISGKRNIEEKTYIQTDVSINPGNSGGPLINLEGEVIGIVNAKIVGHGTEGLGFVIPIKVALDILQIEFN